MDALSALIGAFGLSSSAGLNAYIPLLIAGVLGRLGVLTLAKPFDLLSSWPVLGVLAVLLIIEFAVDKIPGADHVNDAIQTFVRPAAAAILFASQSGVIGGIEPGVGLAIGLVVGLGVHSAKAATRPVVNAGTMGVGAPLMSIAEDVLAFVGPILAIFVPVLFIGLVLILAFMIWHAIKLFRKARNKFAA
jgi:hypothetical protein